MMRPAGSLTARLALLTALWVAIGLLVAWFHVSGLVVRQIEQTFNARLTGLLDAVVAAADVDASGQPRLLRPISEPRFDQPFSGAYWQIETGSRLATSRSLWDQRLPSGAPAAAGVSASDAAGPRGQHLRLLRRDIVLPETGAPLHVSVAVARDATDAEIGRIRRGLGLSFGLLGVGLVGVVVATVALGLRPLRRLRRAIADLRAGRRADLRLAAPAEVRPLLAEIDALVAQNRATVERARNHIGNLAHALRTRLAVLRNALEEEQGADLALASEQLGGAEHLVQHHLARARAAALSGAAAEDTNVSAVAEDVAAALRRLFADRALRIELAAEPGLAVRCERQDLAEMLGNLMENACKWARATVRLSAAASNGNVAIVVEDDGRGLADLQMTEAQARGARLDEAKSGSGLGLAIVADLAALYGGKLELRRSAMGGLAAILSLPLGQPSAPARAGPRMPT